MLVTEIKQWPTKLIMADTGHLLVSATTVLLRCIVESATLQEKNVAIGKVLKFLDRLRIAVEKSKWDLAEFCLERCQRPVEKIASAMAFAPEPRSSPAIAGPSQNSNFDSSTAFSGTQDFTTTNPQFDVLIPADPFDLSWEMLWSDIEGSW